MDHIESREALKNGSAFSLNESGRPENAVEITANQNVEYDLMNDFLLINRDVTFLLHPKWSNEKCKGEQNTDSWGDSPVPVCMKVDCFKLDLSFFFQVLLEPAGAFVGELLLCLWKGGGFG